MKKYRNKLAVAVLAGAFIATSTVGSATATENQSAFSLTNTNSQSEQKVDQSDVKPEIMKVNASVDKVKTIKLNENDVNVLGASWAGENPELKIRYKTDDGWSGWENLPEDDEGGPDLNSSEAKQADKYTNNQPGTTEAIPVLNSSAVQLKSTNDDTNTKDLEVTNVATEVTEEDKQIASEKSSATVNNASSVNAASIQNLTTGAYSTNNTSTNSVATVDSFNAESSPNGLTNDAEIQNATYNSGLKANIVTRKEWGANEKLKRCGVSAASKAKAIFVHHTAGSNSYTKSQAPGIIRGYLSYHTQSKGWCDLGYNFLVDKYGTIYEGRTGSITKAIVGAHASGFNTGTIGISVMGTFTGSAPSTAAQNSVKRIAAWKSNTYGLNPTGKVTLKSGGGGTSKYGAGKNVSLNVISGHRDTSYTECPGISFYNKLPSIRTGAKSLQKTLNDSSNGGGTVTPPKPTTPPKTTIVTKGKIGEFYKKNKSMTGAPTANEKKISSPSGYYQWFKNGKVYYSSKTGAHFVKSGTFNNAYKSVKYEKGSLGYPTSEIKKFKYRSGASYQNFQKGMITYHKKTGAQVMTSTMMKKWKSLGWERSIGKLPTSSMKCGLVKDGCYQNFEVGKQYWTKKTGVHFIRSGAFMNAYKGSKYEKGSLGYPTSERAKFKNIKGGEYQNFEKGMITYSKSTGARVTTSTMMKKWKALGADKSAAKLPSGNMKCGLKNAGCVQSFQGGSIHWSKKSGAHFTKKNGSIQKAWKQVKYENGKLGYPISDEYFSSKKYRQKFEGGYITYSKGKAGKVYYHKW